MAVLAITETTEFVRKTVKRATVEKVMKKSLESLEILVTVTCFFFQSSTCSIQ